MGFLRDWDSEFRVGLVPAGKVLTDLGHGVYVQKAQAKEVESAMKSTIKQEKNRFEQSGWSMAEMIVEVKEPLDEEYPKLREHQILFTYLHLAPRTELTKFCLKR